MVLTYELGEKPRQNAEFGFHAGDTRGICAGTTHASLLPAPCSRQMGCTPSKVGPRTAAESTTEEDTVGESVVEQSDPHPLFEESSKRVSSLFAQIHVDGSESMKREEFVAHLMAKRVDYRRVLEMWAVIEDECKGDVKRATFERAVCSSASRTQDPRCTPAFLSFLL